MPSATDELRAKFPGGDDEAWESLKDLCTFDLFRIRPKSAEHLARFGERQWDAVTYLVDEWDWAWSPEPL